MKSDIRIALISGGVALAVAIISTFIGPAFQSRLQNEAKKEPNLGIVDVRMGRSGGDLALELDLHNKADVEDSLTSLEISLGQPTDTAYSPVNESSYVLDASVHSVRNQLRAAGTVRAVDGDIVYPVTGTLTLAIIGSCG